ncbi:MAG: ABC transporter substrate-binding protein [Rhodospirillales bacterium]|nr:ABC transporter substrate-binding protein [Rhodospirillales bacterium]
MRSVRVLALAGLVALVSSAAAAQHLRIGLAEDPDILDPTLARTFVGRIVFSSLCDKLIDITPDLKIVPQLATGYTISEDGKTVTMKLRQGVTFHDGEPFNAAAAKYSLERHLNMPGSNRRGEIAAISSIETPDDYTIEIHLGSTFAPLLSQLTDRAGMMVSPKAAEALGDKFGTHPVCAGPFKFVERVAQDRIVVERFEQYWDRKNVHLEKITYMPIPDATVRLANLRSGSLDLIERVLPSDFVELKKDPRFKTSAVTELGYQGLTINIANGPGAQQNPLAKDKRIREALELSLDRDAINQVVFEGLFQPGNQWVSPESPWYQKSLPIPKRDVAKAKKLLQEAGMPNPVVDYMVPNDTQSQQVAQVIQAMAKEAGFDLRIRATEFASSLKLAQQGEFDLYQLAWSGRTDPDGNLYNFVGCKGPPALNSSKFCDEEVEKELVAERTAISEAERMKHFEAVARKTLSERPIIYLYHRKWLKAHTTKLTGLVDYPDGLIRVVGLKLQ